MTFLLTGRILSPGEFKRKGVNSNGVSRLVEVPAIYHRKVR
jgi:hypothetical protein